MNLHEAINMEKLTLDIKSSDISSKDVKDVEGIEFLTLDEIKGDPETVKKLFFLIEEGVKSSPDSDGTFVDLSTFSNYLYEKFYLRYAKSIFLAKSKENLVGICSLRLDDKKSSYSALTAVSKAWRNKGIARQLKLRSIVFASINNVEEITVENHKDNRAMLRLNTSLGFLHKNYEDI